MILTTTRKGTLHMERLILQIEVEAELFTKLHARFGDKTTDAVRECLHRLVESSSSEPAPGSHQTARNTNFRYHLAPRPGTQTGKVWEFAADLDSFEHTESEKKGTASREAVVKACEKAGVRTSTATTQFYHWRDAAGIMAFQDQTFMENDRKKLTDEQLALLWSENSLNPTRVDYSYRERNGGFRYVKATRDAFNAAQRGHGLRDKHGDVVGPPKTRSQPYNKDGKKFEYTRGQILSIRDDTPLRNRSQ